MYTIKTSSEFLVAFGSTGCSSSAGGRGPLVPEARTPSGGPGACPPGRFVKLDSLKLAISCVPWTGTG